MERPLSDVVLLGLVTGPHGIRGAIKLKAQLDNPNFLVGLTCWKEGGSFTIEQCKPLKGEFYLLKLQEINTRSQAELLKGESLYIPRASLPPLDTAETFYCCDLIGLKVLDPNGEEIGVVSSMANFGAGDLIQMKDAKKQEHWIPFTRRNIPVVQTERGFLKFSSAALAFLSLQNYDMAR